MYSLHDPTSPAYKTAKKRYLKTTRNRAENTEADWTPFRAAEKKFKARFPPPDLSNVLDLAISDATRSEELERGGWKGAMDAVKFRETSLSEGTSSGRKAYIFLDIPGMTLLCVLPVEINPYIAQVSYCSPRSYVIRNSVSSFGGPSEIMPDIPMRPISTRITPYQRKAFGMPILRPDLVFPRWRTFSRKHPAFHLIFFSRRNQGPDN